MVIFAVLSWVVFVYLLLLVARLVLDWVQVFARDWRPRGALLVVCEVVYSATDPPLKVLRRVLPSIRLGAVAIDLAFPVLFFVVFLLWNVLSALATR